MGSIFAPLIFGNAHIDFLGTLKNDGSGWVRLVCEADDHGLTAKETEVARRLEPHVLGFFRSLAMPGCCCNGYCYLLL